MKIPDVSPFIAQRRGAGAPGVPIRCGGAKPLNPIRNLPTNVCAPFRHARKCTDMSAFVRGGMKKMQNEPNLVGVNMGNCPKSPKTTQSGRKFFRDEIVTDGGGFGCE